VATARLSFVAAGLVVLVLLASTTASAQEYKDVIHVHADTDVGFRELSRLRVESESIDGVTYRLKAGNRQETRKVGEIRAVYYGDAPPEWQQGLELCARREYARALTSFTGALNAPEVRDWIKEHVAYQIARCRAALARVDRKEIDKANEAFEKFLETYPQSRLRPDALLGYGSLLMLAGNPGEARRHFEDAQQLAKSKDLFVRYGFEASLGIADTFSEEKKWAQALPEYESVEQRTGSGMRTAKAESVKRVLEQLRMRAAARRGDALLTKAEDTGRDQDFQTAKSYFAGLTGKLGRADRVVAMSKIGEAVCLLHGGQHREALRQLAEARVRYFSEKDEVAMALYYMSRAAAKLGHAHQAELYTKELKETFPDSDWARRAD
jgi:tetratricopeptide (TPR) repeat protein